VSLPSIEALWEGFNDLADDFGVSLLEFKEILAELTKELGYNRVKIDEKSFELFKIFDQDRVRTDGLGAVCSTSGISPSLRMGTAS